MFGWRKRNDGFEWHKYVRTAVVARRAKRKERLEKAGVAAVSGAKSSAEQARNGLGVLFTWLWNWLSGPFLDHLSMGTRAATRTLQPLGRAIAGSVANCGQAIGRLVAPVGGWFGNRLVSRTFLVLGAVALLAGLVRMPMHGLDSSVLWALAIAAIAFAIWGAGNSDRALQFGGRVLPGSLRHWFAQFFGRARERFSLPTWPGATKGRVAALMVLVVVAAGSTWFVVRDGVSLPSLAALSPFSSEPIKGRASTLTGNLVRVGGQVIQLYGVEAPEPSQRCRTRRGRWWRCGSRARSTLAGLVNGRTLKCEVMGHDDSGRALGHCFAGRRDVGGTLIRRGVVFVSANHPRGYRKLEATARKARKGFWGSKVQRPSEYRAKRWAAAKRQAPDGCPIKGNVTSRGKVYVLPWSSNYRRIRIQMKRGERWFCTEREAIQAGWKLTSRS